MADTITIEVEGVEKAIADLKAAEHGKVRGVKRAIARTAIDGEKEIKLFITNISPSKPGDPPGVDTGVYRASWRHSIDSNGLGAGVLTNSEIGRFLEYGTGRRGATSNRQDLPPGYVHGPKIGMAARPHAGPVSEKMTPIFIKHAKDELSD